MRTLTATTALAVLFSSAALIAVPAHADTNRPIAVKDPLDSVVDGVHQRVFISDRDPVRILVTDYGGNSVKTIGLGAADLELSPDSSTLYAALDGADKIVAFDTATLTQIAEYPTGAGTHPSKVAYADGRLWFAHGSDWDSELGMVDLTAETPMVTLGLSAGHNWSSPPRLYTDPDNPGTLVALDGHISSAPIVVYDISSGTPVIRVSAEKGGFYKDAALTPDGQNIVVAGPGSRELSEYRLSDLADVRTYPLRDDALSVDVAADGTVAATSDDFANAGDTYVFTNGADRPASVRKLSNDMMPRFGHTLNWSPDGGKLFLLSDLYYGARFHALDEPRRYVTSMTVDAPASAPRAKTLTVKGTLTTGLTLPAGTPITVTRTDLESPNGKSLGTRALGTGGRFSFTDVPPAGGRIRYTLKYAGDAEHTPATASDSVDVSRATPALTLNNSGKVYGYGADVRFTAHLGTTYKNRKVEIWADPFGSDKPKKLVKSGTVNASGNLAVTLDLTRDTTVVATFAGDSRYKPRTVSSTVGAKVRVSTTVSGHYRTKSTWGQTYHYVKKSKHPVFTTTMSAYPNRSERLAFEAFHDGRWYEVDSAYYKLGSAGICKVRLTGTHETGWRLRVRASYVNGSSGDDVNSTTHGAWKYFIFTS